jgi:hypothetical protein
LARTAARVLLGLLTTGIRVVAGLLVGLYLGGATWAVNRVLAAVNPYPGTTLRSARVGGNLFRVVRVDDVRLSRPNGEVAVRIDSLTVRYDALSLLGGGVVIREAHLDGPSVLLTKRPGMKWDLLDLPRGPSRTKSSASKGPAVTIGRLSISRGSARVRFGSGPEGGHRVEGVEAEGVAISIGPGIRIGRALLRLRVLPQDGTPAWVTVQAQGSIQNSHLTLDTLSVRSPASVVAAKGTIPLPPGGGRRLDLRGVDISLRADPLALSDLRLLKPDLQRSGTVSLSLDGRGEGSGAKLRLSAESSDGASAFGDAFLTSPGTAPMEYRARVTLRGLDPGLVTLDRDRGDRLSGEVRFGVRGPSLDRLDGRAQVRLSDSRYRAIRARRLKGEAELTAGRSDIDLDAVLGSVRVAVDGWIRAFDSVPAYELAARVAPAPGGARSAWLDRLLGSGGSQLHLHVVGREADPDLADLRAVISVVPGPGVPGLLD